MIRGTVRNHTCRAAVTDPSPSANRGPRPCVGVVEVRTLVDVGRRQTNRTRLPVDRGHQVRLVDLLPDRAVEHQPVTNLPVGNAVQVGRACRGHNVVVAVYAHARGQRRSVGASVPGALVRQATSHRGPRHHRAVGGQELTRVARLAGVDVIDLGLERGQRVNHRLARTTTVRDDLDLLSDIRGNHLAHVDRAPRRQANDQRAVKVNVRVGDRNTVYTINTVAPI